MNRSQALFRPLGVFLLIVLIAVCGMWTRPGTALAHAALTGSAPEPGAMLAKGPEEVTLHFSEGIEASVGSLQVLGSGLNKVTGNEAQAGDNGRSLTLKLPKLDDDVYTVSYRIISEDGHPISGSYVFVVGNPPAAKDASAFDPHKELGHSGHGGDGTELSAGRMQLYVIRCLYYAALLFAAGVMLWSALIRGPLHEALNAHIRKWAVIALRALLLVSLLYVFVHAKELMEGQKGWLKLFVSTSVGLSWDALLLLSLLGFLLLRAGGAVRMLWALLLLAQEAWSGHAAALTPKWATLALDYVHLAGGALWAGGLSLLLALWFTDRKEAGRFAARFSAAAWISIAILTLSGIGMTLLYMPGLEYLLYTTWGSLLLAKAALVVLVIITGALLRLRMKRKGFPSGLLLQADGLLMGLILIIVGLFTYLSPLPANEPVAYHEMGEQMHLSMRISPNVPGDNEFIVKVWLPQQMGEPKSVKLLLRSDDNPELGAITVPLRPYTDDEISSFDGFVKTAYRADGPYVPFAGHWTAQVRVLDGNDDERVKDVPFRNY
ncbi:copper resistance protein CopC [Paenibacillus beijingensis]|uniref:Copper resistance protein CopC n=1 Tax=Paenibacillus beijingensis TaxID=1126833 RepID=A0A0D5NQ44_9BACL|nr:copper resistance protein CopC [Paenibacillus beijingensis]